MRKPTKCKSCNINYELTGKTGKHQLINCGLVCKVCLSKDKVAFHGGHEGLFGEALECRTCHNYILYTNGSLDAVWKDEIYIPSASGNIFVMRDYEDSTTFISINSIKVTKLKQIIEFKSMDDLVDKVKMITLFHN